MSPGEIATIILLGSLGAVYAIVAFPVGFMLVLRWIIDWRLRTENFGYVQHPIYPIIGLLLAGTAVAVLREVGDGFASVSGAIA